MLLRIHSQKSSKKSELHNANATVIALPLAQQFSSTNKKDANNLTYLFTRKEGTAAKKKDKHRNIKLVVPHILMLTAVFIYVLTGAAVFHWIELPNEKTQKEDAVATVTQAAVYLQNRAVQICNIQHLESNTKWRAEFQADVVNFSGILLHQSKVNYLQQSDMFNANKEHQWSYPAALLFSFAIITTIGYGNIAPVTTEGRIFCMIYALIGIPIAMLAIANIGKFIAEGIFKFLYKLNDFKRELTLGRRSPGDPNDAASYYGDGPVPLVFLLITVFLYLCIGALLLPSWESLPFLSAFYFSFISITTTGLGDIVPNQLSFLGLTIAYIGLGVAITSMTIELTADYMRKLHYMGRKVTNSRYARVHINGKTIMVQDIVKSMGKKYGLSAEEVDDFVTLHLDDFMEKTIEAVEEGNKAESQPNKPLCAKGMVGLTDTDNGILGSFSVDDLDLRYIDSPDLQRLTRN